MLSQGLPSYICYISYSRIRSNHLNRGGGGGGTSRGSQIMAPCHLDTYVRVFMKDEVTYFCIRL